jgi:hypothetical protein
VMTLATWCAVPVRPRKSQRDARLRLVYLTSQLVAFQTGIHPVGNFEQKTLCVESAVRRHLSDKRVLLYSVS